ncbi:class I SAM-dependent methyltransferase [uncultured Cetobacterium sp.]|uniref:class I SAM-dependent methyltransferase n=1 Tax=uncultured Cetobacterium sp. TaxID=527638 RepID=UPI00263131BE|nr:class I SAM-dependent methyltransferase [uncultured Cetobacterium sp.]
MKDPKKGYDRWAKLYNKIEENMPMGKFKKEAIDLAEGKILEVGIGSGANLKYYKNNLDIIGIDFSKEMLNLANKKITDLHLTNIKLKEMNIEEMNFLDNTFDTVVSTCVFCTVPNPKKGLKEIFRVLKPGGKAIFLEHMKSRYLIINIFLWILNQITTRVIGTSLLRDTENNIKEVGFSKVTSKNLMMKDVLKLIVAEK